MTFTPPPPARRRGWSTGKTVLVIVLCVVAVCCVAGSIGGYAIYRGVAKASAPEREAANTYLRHLEAEEYDAAYDSLCPETQGQYTREQFRSMVSGSNRPTSHKITGFRVNNFNGHTSGSVTVQVTTSAGTSQVHTLQLDEDSDGWKVCGQPY
jgi:hypothetical protein